MSAAASPSAATVMKEIKATGALRFAQVGKMFVDPFRPTGLMSSTVRRWAMNGIQSKADGKIIKLECVRVGGRYWTSRAAVGRFLEATGGTSAVLPPTSAA